MSIKPGRFIVVEGLEGAGKTTAMKTIKRLLTSLDIDVITTREPGGTFVGEAIRHIIKETPITESLDARAELLLFYAARVQLLEQIIKPSLSKGLWILADRFELSSFAYQGSGRKLDESLLKTLSLTCVSDCQPDIVVYLDITPQEGLSRAVKRGKLDRIEQESLSFFSDVHAGYHKYLKMLNNVIMINASQPLASVQNTIRTELYNAITAAV